MITTKKIYVDTLTDNIYIKPIFDIHIGTKYTNYKMLEWHIDLLKDNPNAYFILGGDMCEFITRKDKRYTEEEISPFCYGKTDIAKTQIDYFVDMFKPIMNKCIGLIKGNHEQSIESKYERSIVDTIFDLTGTNNSIYLGSGGFICISIIQSDKTRMYTKFYVHHGFGSGRKKGSAVNLLEDSFANYDADCILMGHRHIQIDTANVLLKPRGKKVIPIERPAAFCGSYRNENATIPNNDNYVLRSGLTPTVAGGYTVELNPLLNRIRLIRD